jgi:hypothetical protein
MLYNMGLENCKIQSKLVMLNVPFLGSQESMLWLIAGHIHTVNASATLLAGCATQETSRAKLLNANAPTTKHCTLKIPAQRRKRWIPLDLVQNTAEYLGRVVSLLSFRGVSTGWQGAVSDAVGFLNGRCWTELGKGRPLWTALGLDRWYTVARFALLCLGPRLETLVLSSKHDAVLSTWSLEEVTRNYDGRRFTMGLECLQDCSDVTMLDLSDTTVKDGGIRGLELIPKLRVLYLRRCRRITDVSCLRTCRALKRLNLSDSNVTDAGILGLELTLTLEELNLYRCERITDVSCLRSCYSLTKLGLARTGVRDAGIRGLELIPTLTILNLAYCEQIHDLSFLRSRVLLRIITPCARSVLLPCSWTTSALARYDRLATT